MNWADRLQDFVHREAQGMRFGRNKYREALYNIINNIQGGNMRKLVVVELPEFPKFESLDDNFKVEGFWLVFSSST